MSKLRTPGGDDHPDAALKHLLDAKTLLGLSRADGAAYLSGYVVECALKSLWLRETGVPPGKMPWGGSHKLSFLTAHISALASVAGSKTARYFNTPVRNVATSTIGVWDPGMRYRPPSKSTAEAQAWCEIADTIYLKTIAQMLLDGVI